MSSLTIEYSRLHKVVSTSNKLNSNIQNRIDDFTKINSKICSIPSSRQYLYNSSSSASYFIKKKCQQYEDKIDKVTNFSRDVEKFIDNAKATDKAVANRITTEYNEFAKANGLSKGMSILDIAAFVLCAINPGLGLLAKMALDTDIGRKLELLAENTLYDVKKSVKDFYQQHKYEIEIGKDILKVAGLVAITVLCPPAAIGTGVLAAATIAIGWTCVGISAYNNITELGYDIKAQDAYSRGNKKEAEELSEKGGEDFAEWGSGELSVGWGETMNGSKNLTQEERNNFRQAGQNVGHVVYKTADTVNSVYSLVQVGNTASKIYNGYKDLKVLDTVADSNLVTKNAKYIFEATKKELTDTSGNMLKKWPSIGGSTLAKDYAGITNLQANTMDASENISKTTGTFNEIAGYSHKDDSKKIVDKGFKDLKYTYQKNNLRFAY